MRFLTLTKAFWSLASGSASLWQDLSFTLESCEDVEHVAR